MPLNMSNYTGDGASSTLIQCNIQLPDAGSNVAFDGVVQAPGGAVVTLTGSPIAVPAIPGSGSTYFILQANTTTGAVTVKQDPAVMPTADASNVLIFSTILQSTDTSLSSDVDHKTPDNY